MIAKAQNSTLGRRKERKGDTKSEDVGITWSKQMTWRGWRKPERHGVEEWRATSVYPAANGQSVVETGGGIKTL